MKYIKKIPFVLLAAALVLNCIAWCSTPFCDFYAAHIYPVVTYGLTGFSGLFPFSIGELLLGVAVLLVLVLITGGIFYSCFRLHNRSKGQQRGSGFGWYKRYAYVCFCIFSVVCMIMTLNCLILYHCASFSERYEDYGNEREYSIEELQALRNYIVMQANMLAKEMPRDENGYVQYDKDIIAQSILEMQRMGEKYEALAGYYPRPKGFLTSDFFSQQYIMGYFFPFTMEANYNTKMYITNMPPTMCHELSHLKGFIYEDEANFIGYLACIDSLDPFFRYCGYLSVLNYVDNDFYDAIGENKEYYLSQTRISQLVKTDNTFLTPEAWDAVEEKAVLSTEFVKKASTEFVETNLTINGVQDGMISYRRVVKLLLKHYDGILYNVS